MFKIETVLATDEMIQKAQAHRFNPRGWNDQARKGLDKSISRDGMHERNGRPVLHKGDALDGYNRIKALLVIREADPERYAELLADGIRFDIITGRPTDAELLKYVKPDDLGQVRWTTPERLAVYSANRAANLTQEAACRACGYSGRNAMLCNSEHIDKATRELIVLDGQRDKPVLTNADVIAIGQAAYESSETNPTAHAKGNGTPEYADAAALLAKAVKSGTKPVTAKHASSKIVTAMIATLVQHDYSGPFTKANVVELLTAITGRDPETDQPVADNPASVVLANLLAALSAPAEPAPKPQPKPMPAKAGQKARRRKSAKASK